tara:strand:+ start:431 stop:982 length:552 start_codon:yes stop_codon:yes gene_type:complete
MQKVVLSEISLIYGEIKTPKGFEIDRTKIKNDIISSFIKEDRISQNNKDYSYQDYKVPFSLPLQWLKDYLRDHVNLEHNITLIPKIDSGLILNPKEKSFLRNQVDPVDLRNSADYTLIYIVDCEEKSCELIIEFDDNRRKGRTWHVPIKNNCFYIFPATQKYFISENKSKKINVFLIMTYEYI